VSLTFAVPCWRRYGIRGLVIDPYNELDHQRPTSMSETEYVSQMLTKIKRFAQHHDVHVWCAFLSVAEWSCRRTDFPA